MRAPFTITYNRDWHKRQPTSGGTTDQGIADEHSSAAGTTVPTAETAEPPPIVTAIPVAEKPVEPDIPQAEETVAADPSTTTIKTKPSKAKMHVTWDDERKLRKKGSPAAPPDAVPLVPTAVAPPRPETMPERRKSGFFSKLTGKSNWSTAATAGADTVHHHQPPTPPDSPGWKHHDSYFPGYEPIYPTTTFADPYARAFQLTPAEVQAQQHAARVGHAVAIHYPVLPPFGDYQAAAAKGQGAWQSGQWGNKDWTGFGLNGERLPDGEGKTFGAPMPKGSPNEDPKKAAGAGGGGGKKGKGGGGGNGDAGAAAEGGEAAEGGGEAAVPAEGGEAAEGGGSGGAGKKKKKK